MFTRRKSKKEKQEEAEIIELLKHMHQLDRNELIARTQQRDQYIICIIGSIVTIFAGLFQVTKNDEAEFTVWLLGGCLVVWVALVILTYRLINSYCIHDRLIEHTQKIDHAFKTKYKERLPVLPWQDFVNDELRGHRQKSYNYTMAFFVFLVFVMLFAWACVAMFKVMDIIGTPSYISSDFLFSISTAFSVATVSNIFLWESDVLKPKGISIPGILDHGSKVLKEVLLVFLPFLFASLAILFAILGNDNNIFPKNTVWPSAFLNIISILCMRGSKKLVCAISKIFSPGDTNNHDEEIIIFINYILIFVLYAIIYIWIVTFQEATAVIVATIGLLAFISLIRDKSISDLQDAIIAYWRLLKRPVCDKHRLSLVAITLFFFIFLNNIVDKPLLIINDIICGIAVGAIIPSLLMLFLCASAKHLRA